MGRVLERCAPLAAGDQHPARAAIAQASTGAPRSAPVRWHRARPGLPAREAGPPPGAADLFTWVSCGVPVGGHVWCTTAPPPMVEPAPIPAPPPYQARSAAQGPSKASHATKETTMHPTLSYQMAQARIADLRHQAQRDGWPAPPASRRPQPCLAARPVPRLLAAARKVLTIPAAPTTLGPRTAP